MKTITLFILLFVSLSTFSQIKSLQTVKTEGYFPDDTLSSSIFYTRDLLSSIKVSKDIVVFRVRDTYITSNRTDEFIRLHFRGRNININLDDCKRILNLQKFDGTLSESTTINVEFMDTYQQLIHIGKNANNGFIDIDSSCCNMITKKDFEAMLESIEAALLLKFNK